MKRIGFCPSYIMCQPIEKYEYKIMSPPMDGWDFSHGMAKVIMNLNICRPTMRHRMERDLISMSRCKNLLVVVGSLIEYNMLA
jgi:hypothetical protein